MSCCYSFFQNDAVRESLKNLLLVMYTGTQDTAPLLVRDDSRDEASATTRQARLWHQTYARLQTFLPGLMDQLFPAPTPPPVVAPQAPSPAPETTQQDALQRSSQEGLAPADQQPQSSVTPPMQAVQPADQREFCLIALPLLPNILSL